MLKSLGQQNNKFHPSARNRSIDRSPSKSHPLNSFSFLNLLASDSAAGFLAPDFGVHSHLNLQIATHRHELKTSSNALRASQ
jgi:hypothetical protein